MTIAEFIGHSLCIGHPRRCLLGRKTHPASQRHKSDTTMLPASQAGLGALQGRSPRTHAQPTQQGSSQEARMSFVSFLFSWCSSAQEDKNTPVTSKAFSRSPAGSPVRCFLAYDLEQIPSDRIGWYT